MGGVLTGDQEGKAGPGPQRPKTERQSPGRRPACLPARLRAPHTHLAPLPPAVRLTGSEEGVLGPRPPPREASPSGRGPSSGSPPPLSSPGLGPAS